MFYVVSPAIICDQLRLRNWYLYLRFSFKTCGSWSHFTFKQVFSWLQQVFGQDPIPQFEINNFTLSVLEQLANRNQEQNKNAEIITKDYIQKATEYAAEGKTTCKYKTLYFIYELLSFLGLLDIKCFTGYTLSVFC